MPGKTIYISEEEAKLLITALDDHETLITQPYSCPTCNPDVAFETPEYPDEKLASKLFSKLFKITFSLKDN